MMYLNTHSSLSQPAVPSNFQVGQQYNFGALTSPGSPDVNANTNSPYANMIANSLNSQNQKNMAQSGYYTAKTQSLPFSKLSSSRQQQLISTAVAMGYTPIEASKFYNSGGTVSQLAQHAGLDLSNVTPNYAPTSAAIDRAQMKQSALSEINAIDPFITKSLAPYGTNILGFSPKQIIQSISGSNPQEQANFLAAQALKPEMAALRTKALGGNISAEAINQVIKSTYGSLAPFRGSIDPQVFAAAQQTVASLIDRAFHSSANNLTRGLGNRALPTGVNSYE